MFGGEIMRILLDTHILFGTLSNDWRLPEKARKLIENEGNEIYYSIISLWEVEFIPADRRNIAV